MLQVAPRMWCSQESLAGNLRAEAHAPSDSKQDSKQEGGRIQKHLLGSPAALLELRNRILTLVAKEGYLHVSWSP